MGLFERWGQNVSNNIYLNLKYRDIRPNKDINQKQALIKQ